MQFDKTQKRALVFVAGLLGLSWYMGGQYEKADMMRSEADGYAYAYNEGHSDSRKDEDYQPVLTSGREEARFRKILKQRAEDFGAEDWWKTNPNFWEYVAINYGHLFDEEGHYVPQRPEQELEVIAQEWIPLYIASKKMPMSAEDFAAENMLYILEHYTVNWREGGDSVEYHIGTSLMNLADALTNALDTLEEHNRHEDWCEDAKTDEEYENRVERWEGRDGEDENGLLELLMEVQGDGYGLDNLNRYTLTVKEAPVHLRGSSEYYAETFNAPYAGSGSLMNIGQDTSLGNFTSKELTESSAVHGDFNEASLNYSGHQNLQVRGAESPKTRTFVVSSVDYETDGEDQDELGLPQDFTFVLDIDGPFGIGDTTDMQEIADEIVDDISDETGWLVSGFYFQERMPDGTLVSLDAETFDAEYDFQNHAITTVEADDEEEAWDNFGRYGVEEDWSIVDVREAETMTPSEVKVKVTKDVTPKGSKIIVEECVDIQAHKADATANFYRVRFRDPAEMSNFRVPAWAARAANTMGSKYYDVAGSKVTMGQDKSGNWKIQSVMVPKRANVDVDLALKIANHIQDRLEKEGRWASKKCQDNERILIIR